jgi:putative membrane protein insertion efficiency factor
MQLGEMVAIWRARRHQRRQQQYQQQPRRKRDWCDCDCDDLDFCDCDCSPFMLGSLLSLMAISAPTRPPRRRASGPGRAGMVAIRGYQRFLSPHLPFRCRQSPSCSEFGMQAVRRYGLVVGSRLTAARIRRCNPSTPRGTFDPVP